MAKLRVKNFGPIKEGLVEGDGFIDIKKVTVFLGNQGSGKSTVAKLISTFSWLEKKIAKNGLEFSDTYKIETIQDLKKHFEYQNISAYFRVIDEKVLSELEYVGEYIHFILKEGEISVKVFKDSKFHNPKIMYVPSDRNFVSAVENFRDLKGLPATIYTFADEFSKAVKEQESIVQLPINNVKYRYESSSKNSYISGENYSIKLSESSSGFQSLVPMYIVSSYLTKLVKDIRNNGKPSDLDLHKFFSLNDRERIESAKAKLKSELEISQGKVFRILGISGEVKESIELSNLSLEESEVLQQNMIETNRLLKELIEVEKVLSESDKLFYSLYHSFLNIVEEPEQNLYPSSQRTILNSLLVLNNELEENKLVITTHSPYLINFLTLAVKGKNVLDKIHDNVVKRVEVEAIVPIESVISGDDVVIYQLDEADGSIKLLKPYKGIPSDENWLNEQLGDFNDHYSALLEIENFK